MKLATLFALLLNNDVNVTKTSISSDVASFNSEFNLFLLITCITIVGIHNTYIEVFTRVKLIK